MTTMQFSYETMLHTKSEYIATAFILTPKKLYIYIFVYFLIPPLLPSHWKYKIGSSL